MKNITRSLPLILVLLVGLTLTACSGVDIISADAQGAVVEFVGTVDSIGATQWVIQSQTVNITAQTEIQAGLTVGQTVHARVRVEKNNVLTGLRIEAEVQQSSQTQDQTRTQDRSGPQNEFVGVVESIGAESWTVSGQTFVIDAATELKGSPVVGDIVKVHFLLATDGTQLALEIEPFQPGNGSLESGEGELTGVVDSISADQLIVDGKTFILSLDTEIKDPVNAGDTVKVHYLVNADGTQAALEIELVNLGTDGLEPGHGELTGVVESISAGQLSISGKTILITSETEIKGAVAAGDTVKVEFRIGTDGAWTAIEIRAALADQSGSGGSNGSQIGDDHGGQSNTPEPAGTAQSGGEAGDDSGKSGSGH